MKLWYQNSSVTDMIWLWLSWAHFVLVCICIGTTQDWTRRHSVVDGEGVHCFPQLHVDRLGKPKSHKTPRWTTHVGTSSFEEMEIECSALLKIIWPISQQSSLTATFGYLKTRSSLIKNICLQHFLFPQPHPPIQPKPPYKIPNSLLDGLFSWHFVPQIKLCPLASAWLQCSRSPEKLHTLREPMRVEGCWWKGNYCLQWWS